MVLKMGEKVHIMTRRQFENDLRRHFIGEVLEFGEGVLRATGYTFVFDSELRKYVRRPEKRTRVFSLIDVGNIVNVLPISANVEATEYRESQDGHLIVTDGKNFSLDVSEFRPVR